MRSGSGFSGQEQKSSTGFQCRLWGASKTDLSFYSLFPWCKEVPVANPAAAQLQSTAQPGYNPVAVCPIRSQIKSSGLTPASNNGAFSHSDTRAGWLRLNFLKLLIHLGEHQSSQSKVWVSDPNCPSPQAIQRR